MLVGVGALDEITPTACAAPPAVARKATKAASVATTLLDLADGAGIRTSRRRAGTRRGFRPGSYQFLKYKGNGDATRLSKVRRRRPGERARRSRADRGATVRRPPSRGRATW
jgi:hypothetical protein